MSRLDILFAQLHLIEIYWLVATIGIMMLLLEAWAKEKARQNLYKFVGEDLRACRLVEFVSDQGGPYLARVGLANWLCFYRFAAPFVVLFVYVVQAFGGHSNAMALGLWLSAILTDAVDGWIARRRNEMTEFGREFDPTADKAAQYLPLLGIVVCFARQDLSSMMGGVLTHPSMLIAGSLVILRDLVLLVAWKITKTKPSPHGVSKARAVALAAVVGILALYLTDVEGEGILMVAIVAATAATVLLSVVSTVVEMKAMLRLQKNDPAE